MKKPKKKDALMRALKIVTLSVIGVTLFIAGVGLGGLKPVPKKPQIPKVEIVVPEHSLRDLGDKVYLTEIWDDGRVVITTKHQYINQLNEHTVVVTDHDTDEVMREMLDAMDAPEPWEGE